jgi:uncharacterized protein YcfL
MIRSGAGAVILAFLVAACASRSENVDTASALAIDTLKPASGIAIGAPDTTQDADTASPTKTSSGTSSRTTPTNTATRQGETKELGRDSIIRVDTKDKRRQLPPADTTKRP